MKRTTLLMAFCAACLGGCATNSPSVSELRATPPERVFLRDRKPDSATVTILRSKEFAGSGATFNVIANGTKAAEIAWAEWASFPVPPGEVIIELRHPNTFLGAVGDSVVLTAAPNGKYYFRVGVDLGIMKLLRTTEESVLVKQ